MLTALSAADGDEIWTTQIGLIEQRAAIDGDRLYVAVADGRMVALDLESGLLRWEAPVGPNPTEPFPYADRVYFGTNDTHFVCLKASDGAEDWVYPIGAGIRGTAGADADHVYTASMDNLLRAFNRSNGSRKWKQDLGYRPLSGPIVAGTAVAVAGRSATIRVYSATGGKTEAVRLPDPAVTAAAFARTPAARPADNPVTDHGTSNEVPAGPGLLAVVTGDPGKPWLLNLTGQPLPATPAVSPLTSLPGEVLPPIRLPG